MPRKQGEKSKKSYTTEVITPRKGGFDYKSTCLKWREVRNGEDGQMHHRPKEKISHRTPLQPN